MSIALDEPFSALALLAAGPLAVAAELKGTILPELQTATVTSRVMPPQSVHDQLLSCRGASGTEPLLSRSTWFRLRNRSGEADRRRLTSVGAHPKAGLPGVPRFQNVLDQVVPDAAVVLG